MMSSNLTNQNTASGGLGFASSCLHSITLDHVIKLCFIVFLYTTVWTLNLWGDDWLPVVQRSIVTAGSNASVAESSLWTWSYVLTTLLLTATCVSHISFMIDLSSMMKACILLIIGFIALTSLQQIHTWLWLYQYLCQYCYLLYLMYNNIVLVDVFAILQQQCLLCVSSSSAVCNIPTTCSKSCKQRSMACNYLLLGMVIAMTLWALLREITTSTTILIYGHIAFALSSILIQTCVLKQGVLVSFLMTWSIAAFLQLDVIAGLSHSLQVVQALQYTRGVLELIGFVYVIFIPWHDHVLLRVVNVVLSSGYLVVEYLRAVLGVNGDSAGITLINKESVIEKRLFDYKSEYKVEDGNVDDGASTDDDEQRDGESSRLMTPSSPSRKISSPRKLRRSSSLSTSWMMTMDVKKSKAVLSWSREVIMLVLVWWSMSLPFYFSFWHKDITPLSSSIIVMAWFLAWFVYFLALSQWVWMKQQMDQSRQKWYESNLIVIDV